MTLLSLARDLKRRKAREKEELFAAEGVRSAEDLIGSGLSLRGAIVAPQLSSAPRGELLLSKLRAGGVELLEVSAKDFRSAANTESPQGVIVIASVPRHSLDKLELPDRFRLLVLDGVQDPGNVGTILRTAAALGALATLALPGTVDLWNPKVIRSSMGAQFHHPALHVTPEELSQFLAASRIELWAAESGGTPLLADSAPPRVALALGNEGAGLSQFVRGLSARTVSLPTGEKVESLNVAVAAGILLYELRA